MDAMAYRARHRSERVVLEFFVCGLSTDQKGALYRFRTHPFFSRRIVTAISSCLKPSGLDAIGLAAWAKVLADSEHQDKTEQVTRTRHILSFYGKGKHHITGKDFVRLYSDALLGTSEDEEFPLRVERVTDDFCRAGFGLDLTHCPENQSIFEAAMSREVDALLNANKKAVTRLWRQTIHRARGEDDV
jgi:hypothetical protein